jgi:hypothetical protein
MNVLLNAIAFKLGWVSAVFGAAKQLPILVIAGVTAAVAIHLWRSVAPTREALLLCFAAAIGLSWDSVMVAAGWLDYPTGTFIAGLAPYWIVALWVVFATTLNVTFRWLREKLLLAAVMGAIFGPVSYVAGAAAGAVDLVHPAAALVSLSVAWSMLMPGFILVAQELDGANPVGARAAEK